MKEKQADVEDFTEEVLAAWRDKEDNRVADKVNPAKEEGHEADDFALAEPVDY